MQKMGEAPNLVRILDGLSHSLVLSVSDSPSYMKANQPRFFSMFRGKH